LLGKVEAGVAAMQTRRGGLSDWRGLRTSTWISFRVVALSGMRFPSTAMAMLLRRCGCARAKLMASYGKLLNGSSRFDAIVDSRIRLGIDRFDAVSRAVCIHWHVTD